LPPTQETDEDLVMFAIEPGGNRESGRTYFDLNPGFGYGIDEATHPREFEMTGLAAYFLAQGD